MKKIVKLIICLFSIAIIFCSCTTNSINVINTDKNKDGVLSYNGITEEKFNQYRKENFKKDFAKYQSENQNIEETIMEHYNTMLNTTFVFYDNLNAALLSLDRGDINRIILPKATAQYICSQNEGKYNYIDTPENVFINKTDAIVSFSFAVVEDKKDLLNLLNSGIKTLRENGIADNLYKKYIENFEKPENIELPYFENADTIKVVLTGDLPPYDTFDSYGTPQGYNIAYLSELAKVLKINIEYIQADAASRAICLTSGKADCAFWIRGWNGEDEEIDYSLDKLDNILNSNIYVTTTQVLLELNK